MKALCLTLALGSSVAIAATKYASPTGGGDGSSVGSPTTVSAGLALLSAGDTLYLLDGTYTGASAMIAPTTGLSGSSGSPITVAALNDGQVTINGQGVRVPIKLRTNNWFVVQGVNAHNSSEDVVQITGSAYFQGKRLVAWDALDGNWDDFWSGSISNLFEDCAGWGISRKVFSPSQGGHSMIYRRCFAMFQGCQWHGPKMGFTLAYNSTNVLAENCVSMWNATSLPVGTWCVKGDPDESDLSGCWTNYTGHVIQYETSPNVWEPTGCFSADGNQGLGIGANNGPYMYGCVAMSFATNAIGNLTKQMQMANFSGNEVPYFQDCAGYVQTGSSASLRPFYFDSGSSGQYLTSISGGIASAYGGGSYLNRIDGSDDVTGRANWASMFTATSRPANGAWLRYRYQNKTVTGTMLWPWPMNTRIKNLTGIDVTVMVTGSSFGNPVTVTARNLRLNRVRINQ